MHTLIPFSPSIKVIILPPLGPENSFEIKHKLIIVEMTKTSLALGTLFSPLLTVLKFLKGEAVISFLSTSLPSLQKYCSYR